MKDDRKRITVGLIYSAIVLIVGGAGVGLMVGIFINISSALMMYWLPEDLSAIYAPIRQWAIPPIVALSTLIGLCFGAFEFRLQLAEWNWEYQKYKLKS